MSNKPSYNTPPVCGRCGAQINGEHNCQASEKDRYFGNMSDDMGHNSMDDVKKEREFYDKMNDIPGMVSYKPWERKEE